MQLHWTINKVLLLFLTFKKTKSLRKNDRDRCITSLLKPEFEPLVPLHQKRDFDSWIEIAWPLFQTYTIG